MTTTRLDGTAFTSAGASSPAKVLISDNTRSNYGAVGDFIEVQDFPAPPGSGAIVQVIIGFEGRRKPAGAGANPTLAVKYRFGAGAYSTPVNFTLSNDVDADNVVDITSAKSPWSESDVQGLRVHVEAITIGRNAEVDHIFVQVDRDVGAPGATGDASRGLVNPRFLAATCGTTVTAIYTFPGDAVRTRFRANRNNSKPIWIHNEGTGVQSQGWSLEPGDEPITIQGIGGDEIFAQSLEDGQKVDIAEGVWS